MAKKILLLDDEEYILHLFEKVIKKHIDCELEMTNSGEEAMDWVEEKEYDLCLLDINMPAVNGLQVLQTIRASHENKQTPVVMISSMFFDEMSEKAKNLGANDFLTKIDVFEEDSCGKKLVDMVKKYIN